jgi:hypothetical protein
VDHRRDPARQRRLDGRPGVAASVTILTLLLF